MEHEQLSVGSFEPLTPSHTQDEEDDDHNQSIFRTPQSPVCSRQAAWWQSSVVRRSSSAVDEAVDELTEKSQFLLKNARSPRTPRTSSSTCGSSTASDNKNKNNSNNLRPSSWKQQEEEEELTVAPLHREEILVGRLLGEGAFSCVYEVTGFDLLPFQTKDEDDKAANQLRQDLLVAGKQQYALKHLKADLLANTKDFEDAATDLVMESMYLGALSHPNILKLRGQPIDGTASFANRQGGPGHYHDGYFLLTDRLTETLAQRIERWKNGEDTHTNTVLCKARYACQIADAVSYLHEQRILFRDLKPSNVGFSVEDQIQLFDFGLCRELPHPRRARPYQYRPYVIAEDGEEDEYSVSMDDMDESWNDDEDDFYTTADTIPQREEVYFMSGAGTQQYMAPEILLLNRYNLKADCYSFAMTVTEMLLLEKPLPWYPMDEHIQYVCREGDRPCLDDPAIPVALRDLLAWAWEGNVAKRCTMAQAREELEEIIQQIENDDQVNGPVPPQGSWISPFVEAARRLQEFFRDIVERAVGRCRAILMPGNPSSATTGTDQPTKRRDVTFALTSSEIDPMHVVPTESDDQDQDTHQASTSTFPSISASSADCLLPPTSFVESQPLHSSMSKAARAAVLKRKPSSASTTATTDDEFDEDLMPPSADSFSSSTSKQFPEAAPDGGSLAIGTA
ncbi:STE20-like serine/threonine-protein kinase [Seminavis robusta]|uniref:STE20-like serine/threonine-protein kinase n=1 Tax=Seminavis robusta TaxID=568900 RepID=A0A9N8DE73_9STRA|nr:STE20-like serine/threonine-protein kinase [Seminavis robusta]|eukprot:Sro82_g043710.1 STE20-like serine/threonine-protein kinase (680) ;mRNA; r:14509-16548